MTPWAAVRQVPLFSTMSWSLHRFISIDSVMLSDPLLPPFHFPSLFPSMRDFCSELTPHLRWPKYWSFSFNISPSNEYSQLISFRNDYFDPFAVQGIRKRILQHHNLNRLILWCSAFCMVQLSHPYINTGKTIALTRWTFVGKVMSLLFTILSRFVIAFLPRSNHLLISRL